MMTVKFLMVLSALLASVALVWVQYINPLVPNVAKWQRDLRLQMFPFGNVCVHVHFYGF